jgi:hypothetical protein
MEPVSWTRLGISSSASMNRLAGITHTIEGKTCHTGGADALTRASFAIPVNVEEDLYIFKRWSPFRERVDP